PANTRVPPGGKPINVNVPESSGGLGGLMRGRLGGLLAGGAAGSILTGGLNDLLKHLQAGRTGEAVDSWVGSGRNKAIAPKDLANALGSDKVNALLAQTGMSRDELLNALSQYVPQAVDRLTPQGRLPTEQEVQRMF